MRFRNLRFHPKRAVSRAARAFRDAQGFSSKKATAYFMWGWACAKFERQSSSREVTIGLKELSLCVDASRGELVSYWEIWHDHCYRRVPGFMIEDAEYVVDVGANIGAFSLFQAMKARAKSVIAFEPAPSVFPRLMSNIRINRVSNVRAINAVVGSSCGTMAFLESTMSVNCRVADAPGSVQVPSVTLDSSLAAIPRVDLLKVDVEGHEIDVIRGAAKTLDRTERLCIEIVDSDVKSTADELLLSHGLRFVASEGTISYYSR